MEAWQPDISLDEDQAFTQRAFLATWPHIRGLFGPGATYRPVEGDEAQTHRELDLVGGIDGYIIQGHTVRTVAQRTQRIEVYPRANTFTVRYQRQNGTATEYLKRLTAIHNEDAVPSLTIQTYFDEHRDMPIKVGIAHTVALYRWIHQHHCKKRWAHHGGNEFLVVAWWDLTDSDVPFLNWHGLSYSRGPRQFFHRPEWPQDREI